jgi:predicted phosphodiesterase
MALPTRRRGVFLGDIHFPFHHKKIFPLALYMVLKGNYEYVCQVGDLYDWYSASKFPRSFNVFTPKHEKQWSRYYAEIMWGFVNDHLPNAEKFQIKGNHDVRPERRVIEKAPEFETDLEEAMREHYEFPNVKTIHDSREELYIDDICVIHGYYSGLTGRHAEFNIKNVVCGHTHRGGTVYIRNAGHDGGTIFEANAGYLADPYSRGLAYSLQRRATRWTWGILPVDQWGPKFVPLHPTMAESYQDDPLYKDLVRAFG